MLLWYICTSFHREIRTVLEYEYLIPYSNTVENCTRNLYCNIHKIGILFASNNALICALLVPVKVLKALRRSHHILVIRRNISLTSTPYSIYHTVSRVARRVRGVARFGIRIIVSSHLLLPLFIFLCFQSLSSS